MREDSLIFLIKIVYKCNQKACDLTANVVKRRAVL